VTLGCKATSNYQVNAGERSYFEISHKSVNDSGEIIDESNTEDTWNWRDIQFEFNGIDEKVYSGLELATHIAEQPLGTYSVRVRLRKYTSDEILDNGWLLWSNPFSFAIVNRLPGRPHAAYICADSCGEGGDVIPFVETYNIWYSISRSSGEQTNAFGMLGMGVFPNTSQTASFVEWRFEPEFGAYSGTFASKANCYPKDAVIELKGQAWFDGNCVEDEEFDFGLITNGYWFFHGRIHNAVGAGPWSYPIKFYLEN